MYKMIFHVQIVLDIYTCGPSENIIKMTYLLLTCGASDGETTKRIVSIVENFVLVIFGYQQAIRKYVNSDNFSIYDSLCSYIWHALE